MAEMVLEYVRADVQKAQSSYRRGAHSPLTSMTNPLMKRVNSHKQHALKARVNATLLQYIIPSFSLSCFLSFFLLPRVAAEGEAAEARATLRLYKKLSLLSEPSLVNQPVSAAERVSEFFAELFSSLRGGRGMGRF